MITGTVKPELCIDLQVFIQAKSVAWKFFIKIALKSKWDFFKVHVSASVYPQLYINWLPANTVKSYLKGNPAMD